MFPIVPVLAWAAMALGLGTLVWYELLSDDDKRKADAIAGQYAWEIYQKSLDQLTRYELSHVQRLTRAHFG
jgi:hypothetical protein